MSYMTYSEYKCLKLERIALWRNKLLLDCNMWLFNKCCIFTNDAHKLLVVGGSGGG